MAKGSKRQGGKARAVLRPAGGVAKLKKSKKAGQVRGTDAPQRMEQPQPATAPRHKRFGAGAPAAAQQLEVGRTLVCFDTCILLGHRAAAQEAWAAIEAGGGSRVQALVPLKVRLELAALRGNKAGAMRASSAAAYKLLQNMMCAVDCCRVQREDECFRQHAQPLGQQHGDDAILDALLHFHSLGAKVLLATEDKGLALRATEHGLACVAAAQLTAAVQNALAAAPWSAQHDRELALLLFAPGYQQAALGVTFASSHSRESYAAFAKRLQQPLECVLLAATRLLAGDPTTAAAAASCWDGTRAAHGAQQPALHSAPAGGAVRRSGVHRSSSVEQGGSGSVGRGGASNGSDGDVEDTGTPEPPEGGGSAAAAGSSSDEEASHRQRQGREQPGSAPQAAEEEGWDWSWSDSKQAFIRKQRAVVPQALPTGAELRRIVSDPDYREQVLGMRSGAVDKLAHHYGVPREALLEAIAAASKLSKQTAKAANRATAPKKARRQLQQSTAAKRLGVNVKSKVHLVQAKGTAGGKLKKRRSQ